MARFGRSTRKPASPRPEESRAMRTITLELLRHGPAHNQLLSPLTPYLALCENHGAVTLNVPFEHNQFLHRLDALGYALGPEPGRRAGQAPWHGSGLDGRSQQAGRRQGAADSPAAY